MVAWVADSLLDAAVISSAGCVSQVAQLCLSSCRKLLHKLARCPPEEEGLLQPLALLEGGLLQPLALLEWEPPQIHE